MSCTSSILPGTVSGTDLIKQMKRSFNKQALVRLGLVERRRKQSGPTASNAPLLPIIISISESLSQCYYRTMQLVGIRRCSALSLNDSLAVVPPA